MREPVYLTDRDHKQAHFSGRMPAIAYSKAKESAGGKPCGFYGVE